MRDWRYLMQKEAIKLRNRALICGACLLVLALVIGTGG